VHTTHGTLAIETLRIGQRVTTYLPDERREETPDEPTSLEWAAHRVITLTLPCLDDETIHLQLLRDPDWFRLHQPEVGETLWLDMPEMGVEGEALVEAIDEAPEIETGSGRVITATFAHSTGECLEFDIEGESTPLLVTGGHPLWRETAAEANLEDEWSKCCNSLDAIAANHSCGCEEPSIYSLPVEAEKEQAFGSLATAVMNFTMELLAPEEQTWVEAEELQPGDSLKSLNGLRQITNRHLDRSTERVYNIEVDGDHVYRIGESGLLVHNASAIKKGKDYGCGAKAGNGSLGCNRSQLRKNLNCDATSYPSAAHHLIACESINAAPSALQKAEKLGFNLNGSLNGWCLPRDPEDAEPGLPIHTGKHLGDYFRCVRSILEKIERDYNTGDFDDCQLCGAITDAIQKIRTALENGDIWLQKKEPNQGETWNCPN